MQRGGFCLSAPLSRLHAAHRCRGSRDRANLKSQCTNINIRIVGRQSRGHSVHTTGQSHTECPWNRLKVCVRVSVTPRALLVITIADTNGRPTPTLLLALRYTNQTQHWPKPGSWTLVYAHRSSNNHRSHVITQSLPGPKALWSLHVHMQETVGHTSLRVAVCSTTVAVRLRVHVRRSVEERESNYKQGHTSLICWPNASMIDNHNEHKLLQQTTAVQYYHTNATSTPQPLMHACRGTWS